MRALVLVIVRLAFLATVVAASARAERTLAVPAAAPVGPLRLTLPDPHLPAPFPVVLLLADALDASDRADPVVDRLLARGIAVVEADAGEDRAEDPWPPPDPELLAAALADAAPGRLAPSRLGVLGFGAGARAALLWPGPPVVALSPACAGMPIRVVASGALVLHADEPAERVACALLPVRAVPVPGATHAWDHRHGPDEGVARLPHPDGVGPRLLARRYPWAVDDAAGRAVAHLADALLPPLPLPGSPVLAATRDGPAR